MKTANGNWYESPWQPVRAGITRVVFAGHETEDKGITCAVAACENGNAVRPHTHPHAQLAIVIKGQCDYYVDGVAYRMTPGSWLYVPENVEHYIHVYDSDEPVINLDIFLPARPEYVQQYDEFTAGLKKAEKK